MANKTTTTLSITSDIGSSRLNISCTNTLNQASTRADGLEYHTGLHRLDLESVNAYKILEADNYTADTACMLFIKNLSTTSTEYLIVGDAVDGTPSITAAGTIGNLYSGQFMIIPWNPVSSGKDFYVEQSVANMDWEFILFHED